MRFNIPIFLTFFRVIFIPLFVLFFYLPMNWAPFSCALIFLIASLTDWFDGYLARKWNQSTSFGIFLDPVADKILVIIALALMIERYHTYWITLPAMIIIVREIIISGVREWIAKTGMYNSTPVSRISKIKTSVQMVSLVWILWQPNLIMELVGIGLLWIATILTLCSMYQYINTSRVNLTKH